MYDNNDAVAPAVADAAREAALEEANLALNRLTPQWAGRIFFSPTELASMIGTAPEVIRQNIRWGGIAAAPRPEGATRYRIPRDEVVRIMVDGMPGYEDVA